MGTLNPDNYEPNEQRVHFQHRSDSGIELKNTHEGERYVGISSHVVDALDAYIARERTDKRDKHGGRSLFSARQGRPSFATLHVVCPS